MAQANVLAPAARSAPVKGHSSRWRTHARLFLGEGATFRTTDGTVSGCGDESSLHERQQGFWVIVAQQRCAETFGVEFRS